MIKISVVIPLYNKEKDIEETLLSVLNQSYAADEIVIVDDGSTDEGVNLIRQKFLDVRLNILKQKNAGETSARNNGIMRANNEYIALLDADDLWHKDFLLEIKMLVMKYPEAVFYSTASQNIDENGNVIKNKVDFPENFNGIINNFPKSFGCNYGMLNSSCVLIRKSIFDGGLTFPAGEKKGGDICYWLKLSLVGNLAFSAKPLSIFRLNSSNRSSNIHREAIVPCQLKWFYNDKSKLKSHFRYKDIKKFIHSNIFITTYAMSLNKDQISVKAVIKLMKNQKDYFWLCLYPALFMPVSLISVVKKIRRKLR